MLRALVCIRELGISQAEVARETGWSRSQINQTFRSGKLPADAERFRAGLRKWAHTSAAVLCWLDGRRLGVEALCDRLVEPGTPSADLAGALTALVARTHMTGPRTDDLLRLTRVTLYLLDRVKEIGLKNTIASIEAEAAGML